MWFDLRVYPVFIAQGWFELCFRYLDGYDSHYRHPADIAVKKQKGIATVEFALIGAVFFGFMFAIIEISWWLFSINSLAEMSRLGARQAALCVTADGTVVNEGKIKTVAKMGGALVKVTDAAIAITPNQVWPGTVTVTINHTYVPLIPGLHLLLGSENPIGFSLPAFATTLPVETDTCP